MVNISDFVNDPGFPVYQDARLINDYLRSGHEALPPLMTSIGDPSFTAANVPPRLLDYARSAPPELHGYQASMGGLPTARQAISKYLLRTTGLDQVGQYGEDFQIALTAGGTRGVIGDFARLLQSRAASATKDSIPVALCPYPSWDYAGPFADAGYEMAYWPLRAENGWIPDLADARRVADQVATHDGKRLAVIVVNAQHNPTARGWSSEILTGLFDLASAYGAAVLLDDPYFEVRIPDALPIPAPTSLLNYIATTSKPDHRLEWCAVRSLGKQLGVNGWGVGILSADPGTVSEMLDIAFRRRFPVNAHNEWAVARYLEDPASEVDAADQRNSLARKRLQFAHMLSGLGWPDSMIAVGEFTPYCLVAVPESWAGLPDGADRFRRHLLERTGILVAHASIEHPFLGESESQWVRFYFGVTDPIFESILDRLSMADIRFDSNEVSDIRRGVALGSNAIPAAGNTTAGV